MSSFTKGLLVGTVVASLATLLLTTYLAMNFIRDAVIQEAAGTVLRSNIATQATSLDRVREMQFWAANCAIEHVEFMDAGVFRWISDKADVDRLKSNLRGAAEPCQPYPATAETKAEVGR